MIFRPSLDPENVAQTHQTNPQIDAAQGQDSSNISRRTLLKVTALSGVGFAVGPFSSLGNASNSTGPAEIGHFVRIANDNSVTVVIKHLDKGQGVTTGLTAIVAEELDADWSQMRWEFAPADATRYNNLFWGPYQGTGGSTATANSWMQLRNAGAAARQMLVAAAAKTWGVPAAEITVSKGKVNHDSGKTASFGDLAELAGMEQAPAEPKLKDPSQFTLIGTNLPRIDSPEKTTGRAKYTIDIRRPGMLAAVMAHPPTFGATVKSLDSSQALAVPGVKEVVQTPRGVAVIADNYWAATQGRQALKIDWDDSKAETRSSDTLWQEYKALAAQPGGVARSDGNVEEALKTATKTVELEFEFPYLSHAPMEPMNCVVELRANECEIWTGSQLPTVDQHVVSKVTGLQPQQVKINTQFAGGSFGRRAVPDSDYVMEAALIAKLSKTNAPINLQWSREDDIKGGRYRPMAYHKFRAGIDDANNLTGWHQMIVSQSILRGTPFEGLITGPVDMVVTEGGATLPYHIPNLKVEAHEPKVGVPVLWWRSVGHTHNAYATEVFFDEVALAMGKDPVEFRLSLLKDHPRHAGVLKLAAEKANWGRKMPPNSSQGVAVHESFNSYVAEVAEVTLNENGTYKVNKVVCAVDCGIAITPDVIKAQMEGGIGYGLSATLGEKITLKNGQVEQSNFYDYFPLRINQMPDIEVHIVKSNAAPTGVGEPGTPPIGPAVANALRKLTKKPITVLPFGEVMKT